MPCVRLSRRLFLRQLAGSLGGIVASSAALSLSNHASAQVYPVLCSWAGTNQIGVGLAQAPPQPVYHVQQIMAAIGYRVPMQVFIGGVPNAVATVIGQIPTIVYNPDFLGRLHYCNWVAPISILAHEVGHHANLDTTWMAQFKHSWQRELAADWVSGLAMRRLGIPLADAQTGIVCSFGFFSPGSPSHPDSQRRLQAVQAGWYHG